LGIVCFHIHSLKLSSWQLVPSIFGSAEILSQTVRRHTGNRTTRRQTNSRSVKSRTG